MTIEEMRLAFEDLLCRHGGDLRSWPADMRPALLAHLRQSYESRRRLVEMRRMETMLREDAPGLDPPDDLEDRIMGAMLDLRARESGSASQRPVQVRFTAPAK